MLHLHCPERAVDGRAPGTPAREGTPGATRLRSSLVLLKPDEQVPSECTTAVQTLINRCADEAGGQSVGAGGTSAAYISPA
ncbi:hypothetical protein GCM10025871_01920 [Deinococcus metallilatus]|nr:hypothetical protein GCM10025871_01920 [Deinococcus metallilatus]